MYWHWTNLVAWPFPFVFFMSTFYFTKLLVTNLSHQYLNVWLLSRTPSDLLSMCIIVSNIMSCKAWTDCTVKVTAMTTNLDILFFTALITTPGFVILEVYWLIIISFQRGSPWMSAEEKGICEMSGKSRCCSWKPKQDADWRTENFKGPLLC